MKSGVLQGSILGPLLFFAILCYSLLFSSLLFSIAILGPLLFNIYVNDLPTVSQNCNIECYVDDSKLFLSFSLNELDTAVAKVNQDLKRVFEWCCVNHLLINPSLTKIMLFGVPQLLSRIPQDVTFTLMDKKLEPSSTSKDLSLVSFWIAVSVMMIT